MALQGGIKIISGGTLSTAPDDIATRAAAIFGLTSTTNIIAQNRYIFSQLMGNMININANTRVDLTDWATENGYDGWMYSDCIDGQPAYEYIVEKLSEMDYTNGNISGVRFQDAVLDSGVESTFLYNIIGAGQDGESMANCLNNAHVSIDLGISVACGVVPCQVTCPVFNTGTVLNFELTC